MYKYNLVQTFWDVDIFQNPERNDTQWSVSKAQHRLVIINMKIIIIKELKTN